MRAIARLVVVALSLTALAIASSGCQKEGPAERVGKDIDNAVKKVTQSISPTDWIRSDAGSGVWR